MAPIQEAATLDLAANKYIFFSHFRPNNAASLNESIPTDLICIALDDTALKLPSDL